VFTQEPNYRFSISLPNLRGIQNKQHQKEVFTMQFQNSISSFNSAMSGALISNISINKTTVAYKHANTYRHVELPSRQEAKRFVAQLIQAQ
jgi:hypothetical protein